MAYQLEPAAGNIGLGTVKTQTMSFEPQLDVFPLPLSDPSQLLCFDMMGVRRVILLKGMKTDTSQANLMDNFVNKIQALLNGNQSAIKYHSDILDEAASGAAGFPNYTDGDVWVKIKSFDWDYDSDQPLRIIYTLELIECDTVI